MSYWPIIALSAAIIVVFAAAGARRKFWRFLGRVARGRMIAAVCIGTLSLGLGSIESVLRHPPAPFVHDEFAHLLAARTFLQGRLTNPTPAMWEHFETFHELMRPTYMSKYPPAQGLALAMGMLAGFPLLGSMGAVALGCVATYWMLLAWLSPRWSFLGGLFAATYPAIFDCSQGYWTGGVGLLGGALLCGVVTRVCARRHQSRACLGAIAGIAIALLLNHRPFEGGVTIFLSGLAILLFARPVNVVREAWQLAWPATLVLIPVLLWMGYYNWRVTGSVVTLPYNSYEQQYAVAPAFYWQRARPIPAYRHDDIRELQVDSFYAIWLRMHTWKGLLAGVKTQVALILSQCFKPWLLALPMVLAILIRTKSTRRRFFFGALLISVGSVVVHLLCTYTLAFHYVQSAAPMLIAAAVLSMRQVSVIRFRQWRVGAAIVAAVFLAQLSVLGENIADRVGRHSAPGETRQHFIEKLEALPGQQLVLVRYTPGSQLKTFFEWVYNDPDPDRAKIVWARSMGFEKDRELTQYYKDRALWLLNVDGVKLSFIHAAVQQ